MPTTSSIGSASRTYATVALWWAAFTTGGWIGECYNDIEFDITSGITLGSVSTTALNFATLTCHAGQSWRDNASVQTNAFAYSQTNGVGLNGTASYTVPLTISVDFVTVSGLQIKASGNPCQFALLDTGGTHNVYENMIFDIAIPRVNGSLINLAGGLMRNCLVIARGGMSIGKMISTGNGEKFANCTFVTTSNITADAEAIDIASGTGTFTNCAFFGFATFVGGGGGAGLSGSNNCSDLAITFGSSNQASKTYANQFAVTTSSGADFKVKNSSADLFNNAATDTTDIPAAVDAAGTSRPQGAAWDIGAWELVVAAPASTFPLAGWWPAVNAKTEIVSY